MADSRHSYPPVSLQQFLGREGADYLNGLHEAIYGGDNSQGILNAKNMDILNAGTTGVLTIADTNTGKLEVRPVATADMNFGAENADQVISVGTGGGAVSSGGDVTTSKIKADFEALLLLREEFEELVLDFTEHIEDLTIHFTMLDEDNFASDSDTQTATQQSIKAYVDAAITAGVSDLGEVETLNVIYLNNITGEPFEVDETIIGGTSGSTATVVYEAYNIPAGTRYLLVRDPVGPFHTINESITGLTSGATASSQGAPLNVYGDLVTFGGVSNTIIQGGRSAGEELWLVANPEEDTSSPILLGSHRKSGFYQTANAWTGADMATMFVGSLVAAPGESLYGTPFQGCCRVVGDSYFVAYRGIATKENGINGNEMMVIEFMMPYAGGTNETNCRDAGSIGVQWTDATSSAEYSQVVLRPVAHGTMGTAIAARLDNTTNPKGAALAWLQPSVSNSFYEGVLATFVPDNGSDATRDGYLRWDVVDNSGANSQSEVLRFGYDSTASAGEEGFLTLNGVLDVDYSKTILPSATGSPTLGDSTSPWPGVSLVNGYVRGDTGTLQFINSASTLRGLIGIDEAGTSFSFFSGYDMTLEATGDLFLIDPTIDNFTYSQHSHEDATSGGMLSAYKRYNGVPYDATSGYEISLSYVIGTRTLTITPSGATFDVWIQGTRYTFTGAQAVAHADTSDEYFVYFDNTGTLVATTTPWDLLDTAPIASITYTKALDTSGGTTPHAIVLNELHTAERDPQLHYRLHFGGGTTISTKPGKVVLDTSTYDPSFTTSSVTVLDEDIELATGTRDETFNAVKWRYGASGYWEEQALSFGSGNGIPFLSDGTQICWNEYTGGAWQKTAVTNNAYVNMWLVACTALDAADRYFILPGQAEFGTVDEARDEDPDSVTFGDIAPEEMVIVAAITYERKTSHGAAAHYASIVDSRTFFGSKSSTGGAGVTDHGALGGLTDPDHVAGSINFTTTDVLLGRSTAGAGAGEEVACTAAARTVLDDTTVAAMVDTLGGASSVGTGGLVRSVNPTLTGLTVSGGQTSLTHSSHSATTYANYARKVATSATGTSISSAPSAEEHFSSVYTTDATVTDLFSWNINTSGWGWAYIEIEVLVRRTNPSGANDEFGSYMQRGSLFRREHGTFAGFAQFTNHVTYNHGSGTLGGFPYAVSTNTTLGTFRVQVTGTAGHNLAWWGRIRIFRSNGAS